MSAPDASGSTGPAGPPRSAPPATPNRYELYERAAQSPLQQARFLRALHPAGAGDTPLTLGEDFCGSGAVSIAWASLAPGFSAVAADHDPRPLERLRTMRDAAGVRVSVLREDVMRVSEPVDVVAALNFSVCEFHQRSRLLAYLGHVRTRLRLGGLLVCDLYAGMHAMITGESEVELRADPHADAGVQYVWEQRSADPLTGRVRNAMHFVLPDGRRMRDAFVYDWRLWSIPELRDAMSDAGFASTEAHDRLGCATDQTGAVYPRPVERPEDLDDDFVAYVVART